MLPWVQVYSSLREHHKIDDLADELKLKTRYEAIGLVVSLWLWAVNNALDGDISKYRPRAIAEAVGWRGNAAGFVDAMVKVGLLDRDGDTLYIHDWLEYTSLYVEKEITRKERDRVRASEYRKRKRERDESESSQERHGDGHSDIQKNHALPYITNNHNHTSIYMEEGSNPLPSASQGESQGQAPSLPPPEESQFERFWKAWAIISHDGMEEAREAWNECIRSRQDAERAIFRVGPYWYACSGGTAKKVSAAEWLRKGGWK